jgi:hypothetical protein
MRKEVIFAIFAGIVFGLVIAFGVWRTNSALKSKEAAVNKTENTSEAKSTNNNSPNVDLTLTIATPADYDVLTENPVEITGLTKPDVFVVISGEDQDYLIKSDGAGEFKENIDLAAGVNSITVFALDESGKSVNQNINLVYSSEFAKDAGLNTNTDQ